jgi:hypothetical protein
MPPELKPPLFLGWGFALRLKLPFQFLAFPRSSLIFRLWFWWGTGATFLGDWFA